MKDYQKRFIDLATERQALCFGEYKLKSGRSSPYFFNAGLMNTGGALAIMGDCYAAAVADQGLEFDMLFGPAYKGIPLVSALSIALYRNSGLDLPYAFNRKEAKAHGEGGQLVGAPLAGRVLIVDDVITAGTTIREVLAVIEKTQAKVVGVVIGLDRQERGQGKRSAIQEMEEDFGIPVFSIIKVDEIIAYLRMNGFTEHLNAVISYREKYGVS